MTVAVIHTRQSAEHDLTVAGIALADGDSVRTDVLTRPGADAQAQAQAQQATVLDAFESIYRQALAEPTPPVLYVGHAETRAALTAVAASFPAVQFVTTTRGRIPALLHTAGTAISAHLASLRPEPEPTTAPKPELLVATDASKCTRRRGVGVACVSADGIHRQKVVEDVRSVLHGELLAIELAVTSFPNRPLHVLTDSRAALACLGTDRIDHGDASATVDRIRHRTRGLAVRYSWVRGHNGHTLNEAAHRLAVAARRGHEADIPQQIRHAVAGNIVAPLLTHAA
ncbi:RNase H family protein [Prescottella sp. R16]|uniref:RNase H family protein n=1 Tax=Prescottella sp. R16 TaxID=3064529 RepID=UPI00272E8E30|nr:RNase H family protein [Prescottella sp. R16]